MEFVEQLEAIKEKVNPRFTVPVKLIPESKNWEVGKTYEIGMKVKQVAIRQLSHNKELEVTFEIEKMETEYSEEKRGGRTLDERLSSLENNVETA